MRPQDHPATQSGPPARSKRSFWDRLGEWLLLAAFLVMLMGAMYFMGSLQAEPDIEHEWQEIEAPGGGA